MKHRRRTARVPPVIGSDTEFANFLTGLDVIQETGSAAAQLLLAQIDGVRNIGSFRLESAAGASGPPPQRESSTRPRWDEHASFTDHLGEGRLDHGRSEIGRNETGRSEAGRNEAGRNEAGRNEAGPSEAVERDSTSADHAQDSGRKFLSTNAGGAYIDLNHLELPTPEVANAVEFVSVWHATIGLARRAAQAVNRQLRPGVKIQVLANNSDGLGHSYGSHLSFLLGRCMFDDLFHRRLHQLLFLASFQASSIVLTGQGKVGSENGRPPVDFQLSQRVDFLETLCGEQTTFRRPLVNSRDEALCGSREVAAQLEYARLHCIFYDSNLCHVANFLKVGMMQLILVMISQDACDLGLVLDEPLRAVLRWSHDPALTERFSTVSDQRLTAVEHQLKMLELAEEFQRQEGFSGLVPRADWILARWREVLECLHRGDFMALFGVLDWVTKYLMLQRTLDQRPHLSWQSPEIKHLDHLYSNVMTDEGLYWAYERQGLMEALVSPEEIERSRCEPPEGTRAWTRAMLLRLGGDQVDSMDWDTIRFKLRDRYGYPEYHTVSLANPLGWTREVTEPLFASGRSLLDVIRELNAIETSSEASV